jgi:basic amino acid/polyamine antiporter, APA family
MKASAAIQTSGGLATRQFLTIGIGAIMGVGWAVAIGEWLDAAGPLGSLLGFSLGGALMLPAAMCYAELATALPATGGEVVYISRVFGRNAAFMVGWFLVLMATVITSFEAISIGWFMAQLAPAAEGPVAYRLFDHDIHGGTLLIGTGFMLFITVVNVLGAQASGRFQEVFTYIKGAAVVLFVGAALILGRFSNFIPLFSTGAPHRALHGALWIASTASLWFSGFQIIPQTIEERGNNTSVRTVGKMTVLALGLGILFYCAVVFASTLAVPWRTLVSSPLPAATAIQAVVGTGTVSLLILGSIVLGILATWNAAFLWASRLLLALARQGSIPQTFARVSRFNSPTAAVLLVGAVGLAGMCLGRGALVPIINMASISLTFSYVFACCAVLRLRRTQPQLDRPYRVLGGRFTMLLAILSTASMAMLSLLEPAVRARGIPLEWILLASWSALGFGLLLLSRRRVSRIEGPHG